MRYCLPTTLITSQSILIGFCLPTGVDVLAVWQILDDPNTLAYLLAYKDRAAREAGWAAFNADPEWTKLRISTLYL
jgi:hypothetical protein